MTKGQFIKQFVPEHQEVFNLSLWKTPQYHGAENFQFSFLLIFFMSYIKINIFPKDELLFGSVYFTDISTAGILQKLEVLIQAGGKLHHVLYWHLNYHAPSYSLFWVEPSYTFQLSTGANSGGYVAKFTGQDFTRCILSESSEAIVLV